MLLKPATKPLIPTESAEATIDVIWEPLPGSQTLALIAPCHHILYHGARGPGKTLTQLMRFRSRVGIGYGKYWRGVIFDREFDNLAGLVAESKKWFTKFDDGAKFLESPSQYKWIWPTGEELLFRHVKKPEDYEGFHGHEYPFVGWNELTKYPSPVLYDKFMSVNRSSFDPERDTPKDENGNYLTEDGKSLPPIPLEVFSTTNPSGAGHGWVKERFIDAATPGSVVRTEVEVFNPQKQANDVVVKTQVALFGSYRENKYLPPEYVAELESITDENLRRAWLYGDWDVTFGGAFDDLWNSRVHILPRFVIPKSWRIDRSFDWGSSTPFSVGWWAEADGTEATIIFGGQEYVFCPQPGSLIRIHEWYGTTKLGTNKGLKLGPKAVAQGIIAREKALLEAGWIHSMPEPGPADNQIRNVNDTDTDTIENRMKLEGVHWTESDKSPGSNAQGMEMAREMLQSALDGEGKALYCMEHCKIFISKFPHLPRDEVKTDEVSKEVENHFWDDTKYRILKNKSHLAKKLQVVIG